MRGELSYCMRTNKNRTVNVYNKLNLCSISLNSVSNLFLFAEYRVKYEVPIMGEHDFIF